MNYKLALIALTAGFVIASPAQALMLTNEDAEMHAVTVTIGAGESETIEIAPAETVEDVCAAEEECTLALANGASEAFGSDAVVTIRDGAFVVTQ